MSFQSSITYRLLIMNISNFIRRIFLGGPYLCDKLLGWAYKQLMGSCGKNVYLRPSKSDFKGLKNFYIGNNVSIPTGSIFYSTEAKLIIKDNVIFGPRPTIITGDHRVDVIGIPIILSHEKKNNDADVIVGEDVWAGANITILKGVTIGRGSVIAAGAIVNKSIPSYSIVGGVPAKVLKYRFSIEEVIRHEEKLYPKESRLSIGHLELERQFNKKVVLR